MAQVQMPDGAVVEMPDQLDPQLGARLRAFHTSLAGGEPKAPQQPEPDHTLMGDIGHNALGAAEIAGSSIANAVGGVGNAALDLGSRIFRGQGAHPIPIVEPGQAAHDFVSGAVDTAERGNEALGMGDRLAAAAGATAKAGNAIAEHTPDFVKENVLPVAGDVATLAGARAGFKDVAAGVPATAIGRTTQAARTAAAGGNAVSDAATAAQATQAAARTAEAQKLGFRNGEGQGAASAMAGSTKGPALTLNNADAAKAVAGGEAGVPHDQLLGFESLAKAREPAEAVFERTAKALPNGELDATAAQGVDQPFESPSTTSDAARNQVSQIAERLKAAKDGDARLQDLRSLRQEGYKQAGSDDVDTEAIGKAKLRMADAVEGHIERNLPANGDVDAAQFKAARTALAKNWTVQSVLKGQEIDQAALARLHTKNPNLLTGPMRTMAQFAADNPDVTRLPSRNTGAPSVAEDIKGAVNLHTPIKGAIEGATGALGRRLLTGGSKQGAATARGAVSGPLGNEFAPLQPKPPEPPPDMAIAGEGAGGPHGGPAGPQGDIPLADVLSHGVEQSPPAGLSVGPMGTPEPQGVPFQRNAAHEAGDLSLGDMVRDLHARYGAGSDVPGVMSQGVPEGIMMRSSGNAKPAGKMPSAGKINPASPKIGDYLANNASGESAASLESINRGTRDLVQVDADGNGTPLLRDVTQIDARAPKGNLIVDRRTGEIIDRGGMNQRMAEGLRNRYASRVKLGDNFAPPRG